MEIQVKGREKRKSTEAKGNKKGKIKKQREGNSKTKYKNGNVRYTRKQAPQEQ